MKCLRVEDEVLWRTYAARRAEIRKRSVVRADVKPETAESFQYSATLSLDHGVNEVWLLHGTSEVAANAISKGNFIPSTGGCFGAGVYFADTASKSNGYAKAAGDGCKIMLLCRVVLGNVRVLPKGSDSSADRFAKDPGVDTILGETNAREFVVYDATQIYPEYIMYYKES
ncbi:Tiparp [Symbiodinium pilosum]|uniref:Poly [ADP-ribose] polymerase n=1 Tax=Symbiodinium pilosum TaxID=2952 RepID=A0A812WYK0_SYMPI|nr:Tiparp [Symbiodinium pilosum]